MDSWDKMDMPQDVSTFINNFPRHPNNLDIIIGRQEHSNHSHHDFRVRRSKVLNALNWLIANSVYLSGVTVNDNVACLPEDDNLSDICTVTISSGESTEPPPLPTKAEDPYTANL